VASLILKLLAVANFNRTIVEHIKRAKVLEDFIAIPQFHKPRIVILNYQLVIAYENVTSHIQEEEE
jgi:hypothetical protein